MDESRSPMLCLLSFAVALSITGALPAVAPRQTPDLVRPSGAHLAQGSDLSPATRSLSALAAPDARISFGVRPGAIQHVVPASPFDDVYEATSVDPRVVTLVTVHRFGEHAAGGVTRVVPAYPRSEMRVDPTERPLRIGPSSPVLWNLSERVGIAFGVGMRPTAVNEAGLERSTTPLGSVTIEFGDRK